MDALTTLNRNAHFRLESIIETKQKIAVRVLLSLVNYYYYYYYLTKVQVVVVLRNFFFLLSFICKQICAGVAGLSEYCPWVKWTLRRIINFSIYWVSLVEFEITLGVSN